ncbi:MAG: SDR family NAD(P)-dependent oxidoreductase, partial [Gammaproteobacteria bacterium]|nr:SDR family NAD(P)-dependent oxidoreductase [Gammaproteobacteria bacterium]
YGVIKASAINSGGHTHGYTVPNPNAQQQLITDALRRSEINAETLSYLEAHGTGTLLGDPIEIKALTKAFRHDTQKVGYCAIGSIKSNIGHGESAAGIAGITKVLLQLKHKKLVPTLHAEQENPKIDFANSPFVVQKQLSDWRAPTVLQRGRHVEVPRRAGLSSFGAGGANAHLILEECPSTTHNVVAFSRYCVLLSARDETRLQQQASQLLAWLEQPHNSTISLASLAYTLQVGREAMQVRAGLLVANMDELSKGLIHLVKGTDHAEIYRSEKTVAQPLNSLFEDADLNDVLHSWVRQGKLHKLVEAWVQGVSVDWTNLYSEHERPYRISLPGYPFAPESHWVPRQNKVAHEGAGLHPMVQRNVSDLSAAVKFRTTLTGAEFFIKDHQVNGHFILPAAAYLEMFRASASLVWEQCADTESQLAMTNLIWLTPMKVDTHGLDIEIKVEASTASELAVSVHHHDIQTLYCQGNIQRLPFSQQDILDLAAIKARCSHAVIDGAHCYETYQACGVQFGPSLRATDTIYSGANEALAKLQLPTALAANLAGYHLHPSILDAALQAISGIKALDEQMQTGGPLVPFALERIEILGTCSAQMWSWARLAEQDKHKQVTKFDIELCDDQGVVCVRMRGFSARVLSMDTPHQSSENHLYHPVWELAASEQSAAVAPLCVLHKGLSPEVEAGLKDRDIEVSKLSDGDYETVVCEVIERFQQLLASKATGLVQVVISAAEMESGWYGLSGLLRSVMQESPHLHAQLIGLDEVQCSELSACLEALADNSKADPQESVVCYEDNQKKVLSWRASEEPSALNVQQVWRSGCSYLISGGLGGLGQIFAQEILKGSSTAEVILLGRSPARLGWQEAFGVEQGRVHYYQVDIADKASLAEVLKEIRSRHTKVKGVLHSAGVVKDNYLIKKSSEEVMSVLSAKVSGLENLDTLTSAYELEFFVAFSSMAGVLGNAGQGDYAAANAYMDGYMRQRAQAVATGKRYGISLSIAWPLWQEGGMTVDSETLALTMGKLGLLAMPTESGIKAFYEALAMNHANVLVEHRQHQIARYTDEAAILCTLLCELLDVLATELEFDSSWQELGCDQLKLSWLAEQVQLQLGVSLELNQFHEFDTPAKVLQYIQSSHKGLGLKGKVRIEQEQQDDRSSTEDSLIALLTRIVGKHIGMAAERIAVDDEFEQFGIDSVTMLKMTSELEQEFGSLPKTLFFEYKSIEQLSEYFSEYHDAVLATWRNPVHATATQATARASFDVSQAEPHRVNNEAETADDLSACERLDITAQDIAVIGIAGQYPGADGLDEFWLNLLNGVDSISPVPQSRWAHEDYYDSDKRVVGKTYAKWGGFIDDFDKFDPLFFNISPREANGIDPQERLFLQTAYHALEDAGYNPMTFNQQGTVGVYAGVMYEEYQLYGQVMPDFSFVLPGNPSAIANRVSFYFNLTGPSLAVDSMCSSSLTTIHLACQSIRSQECDAAIAGGVNLSLHPNKFLLLAQGGFAASQPGCRSFGEGGDGYVPGEGVGAVVLKPLAKAMADNDAIHVIIKGSAINHGGRANGYSVPDPLAQAQVIRKAYDNANVDVATVSYIEAHGTGTSLGDPIEVEALRKVFGQHGQQRLMLGSVKSNVGHCESAAGIAGLTKVILQMKHAKVVPSLHSKVLNPNINFAELPFHVPQEVQEWPRMLSAASRVMSRRAGISAFGAGGANAHLVVEEYIAMQPESVIAHEHCIILSAKTRDALVQKARDLSEALQTQTLNLRDVAYTLQCGREAMSERLAFVADSVQVCIDNLSAFVDGNEADWVLGKADKSMRNQCLDEQVLAELAPHELKITLQSHWLKGGKVQWQQCYASQPAPQKCHLPLYPFEKRRCWYTKLGAPSVKQAAVSIPASSDEDIESANIQPVNLGYSWHVKALAPSMARTIGSTLILATSDTQELARNIARRIDVVHVLEVDALGLNGVAEIGYYQNVIDVCGCSKTKIDELVWFELVQSLVRDNHKSGLHMMAVTHMTHQLNANDEVVEEGAMQAALYTLLQEEYQGVSSWTVDIDSRLSEPALAQLLWGEFTQQQPDNVVAYRQAQRY